MPERTSLPGLDEQLATRRLLCRLRLPHEPDEPESALSLLARLERQGVHGRLTRIANEDLRQLDGPTLILLRDRRWLLVTTVRHGRIVVEDSHGHEQTFSFRAVSESFAGMVFDRTPQLPTGGTVLSRIARLMWQHRRALYPVVALVLLLQGLSLLGPQLTRMLVDDALPQDSTELIYGILAGMFLIALLRSAASWLEQCIVQLMQVHLDASLERGLLAHVLRLPYRFLEAKSVGQIIQGFMGITQARTALTVDVLGIALGSLTGLCLLVAMSLMMPVQTLLVVAVGAASSILAVVFGSRQERLQRQVVDASVRERESALEILGRITTLKAAGAAGRAMERWLILLRRSRALIRQNERLTLACQVSIDVLGQVQLQALWIWGGLRVLAGALQLGELIAFTAMATLFHAATGRVARSFVKLRELKAQVTETECLLAQQPVVPTYRRSARRSTPDIEVRDLWFRYGENRPWVFEGLDLVIAAGEIHHLRGPSGFGKSTLLKLVAGLYEPCKGEILIGGRPPQAARDDMIFVPQHVRTFNASVRENLVLFSGGAQFAQLMRSAELTGLAKHVQELPMGYETLLAHGGANFSGGQRQLIALTAALTSDKPVLLLDEATANLDASSARRLLESPLFEGRTVVHAGHDLQRVPASTSRVRA
ncbi:peptidase domain-containing ABC transporter [Peristeroidobacter agariperforans]|uniref:peptidase domain-containing ABC transporter n=1 Tax=Peristeroidobacter agariperforans TaxID=268404 RepID=UPI001E65A954|nr:ATP-binding cassette domain-containing protein [Peristeroidobacter agariperforans]